MKTIITLKNTTEHIQVKKKMGIYLMGNIGKQFIHFQNLIQKFQTPNRLLNLILRKVELLLEECFVRDPEKVH
jgi:hypothetical protein